MAIAVTCSTLSASGDRAAGFSTSQLVSGPAWRLKPPSGFVSINSRLLETLLDALRGQRHVALRRRYAGMPHHLLELVHVEIRLDELATEGMAEHVGRELDASLAGDALQDGVEVLRGERLLGTHAGEQEQRLPLLAPFLLQVAQQDRHQLGMERNGPILPSFAGADRHRPSPKTEIRHLEPEELCPAHTSHKERRHHRFAAAALELGWPGGVARSVEHLTGFPMREAPRQALREPRLLDGGYGILRKIASSDAPLEVSLQVLAIESEGPSAPALLHPSMPQEALDERRGELGEPLCAAEGGQSTNDGHDVANGPRLEATISESVLPEFSMERRSLQEGKVREGPPHAAIAAAPERSRRDR